MSGLLDLIGSAQGKQIYVLDTNIIVDYVDVIPDISGGLKELNQPTVDLSSAIVVVPSTVIRELSNFKKEKSERGRAARTALGRLREIAESQYRSIEDFYKAEAFVKIPRSLQIFIILPVENDFKKKLLFQPSENDMDGQIILTALKMKDIVLNLEQRISGDDDIYSDRLFLMKRSEISSSVTLLTNDNGLAIRARERGILTMRYGYKFPAQYTGRRDLVVPAELFREFWTSRTISRELWETYMPDELPLIANEFLIMSVADPKDYPADFDHSNNPYFQNIGRYDAIADEIVPLKYVSSFPIRIMNPGQAIYAEALLDPSIAAVICDGPAGSGKTFIPTCYGYEAVKQKRFLDVHVVPCEDHSNLGALPGGLEEKLDPAVRPYKNALRNYLLMTDKDLRKQMEAARKFGGRVSEGENDRRSIKTRVDDQVDLIWSNCFTSSPVEKARGLSFDYELAIFDEFQDQSIPYAKTLVTRLGEDGKVVICGDTEQIRSPYLNEENNGLTYVSRQLMDLTHVAQVHFTEDEVVRHPLVKLITKRQKDDKLSEQ